ncbi:MAG: hypothetical protein K8R40_05285 [Anaerolineaceae bacterium]|nr:hypothetical protein [Anaerolineaceae bacterium]
MNEELVTNILSNVCNNKRYQFIEEGLIRNIIISEMDKGRSKKETVKQVRAKLHQIGGAYQELSIPYQDWSNELHQFQRNLKSPGLINFCQSCMPFHRSTKERLPILPSFYSKIFSEIGSIHSIMDLACGLNPLTLPWMNLPNNLEFFACDIYSDMIGFLNTFFTHTNTTGTAFLCDLTTTTPDQQVDVVFAFKTIPCLEQVDKKIGRRLLSEISAPNIFVSFPVQSLGGHEKGMRSNYRQHFFDLIKGKNWIIKEYLFSTELVFLIQK